VARKGRGSKAYSGASAIGSANLNNCSLVRFMRDFDLFRFEPDAPWFVSMYEMSVT
jgi:hypothetical protein